MAKSVKLKEEHYIDSTGIVHEKKLLNTILNDMSGNIEKIIGQIENGIEIVENDNGKAIKFSNGIMICSNTQTFSDVKIAAAWGSMYASSGDPRDFDPYPVPFVEVPECVISIKLVTNDCWLCSLGGLESLTNPIRWQLIRPNSLTVGTVKLNYIAIGKWK